MNNSNQGKKSDRTIADLYSQVFADIGLPVGNPQRVIERKDDYQDEREGELVRLCRTAYCATAALQIYQFYEEQVEIWGLCSPGSTSVAHYFVMYGGKAIDIGHIYTLPEMIASFPDGPYEARPIAIQQLLRDQVDSAPVEALKIINSRVRAFLDENKTSLPAKGR
jgi:hypothetical protein